MSANRNRGGKRAMARSYMKRFSSTTINGGVSNVNSTARKIYQQFDHNPSIPLPTRRTINKHDPSQALGLTKPMLEKLKKHFPGHFGLQPKPTIEWYIITLVDSPLSKYQMFYSGFTNNSSYYFTWLDKISGITRISLTLTKSTALRLRDNGLKGIPWK